MSGHSKWSQIKRKKGVKDQARGALFSKLSRLITLAVIEGGGIGDPDKNVKLRLAVEKAKSSNMPKENIERAIEKGSGPDRENLQEVIYEAFAPGGINLIIVCTTDNPNRTISEVRNTLERGGGKLGAQGSVAYLFKKCGTAVFDREQEALEFAEKVEAFDIEQDGGSFTVYFPFENLGHVSGISAEVDYKPTTDVKIEDRSTANRILRLVESLENLDDVQHVFANFDLPEEFMRG